MNEVLAISASLAAVCWFIFTVVLFVKYDEAQMALNRLRARHRASAPGNSPTRGLVTREEKPEWYPPS